MTAWPHGCEAANCMAEQLRGDAAAWRSREALAHVEAPPARACGAALGQSVLAGLLVRGRPALHVPARHLVASQDARKAAVLLSYLFDAASLATYAREDWLKAYDKQVRRGRSFPIPQGG